MCSDRTRALVALTLASLWACETPDGSRALPAAIDEVDPVCGDTAGPTPIVLRGTFPVLPRVSLSNPDRTEVDATYRAWLGDVELLHVTWRDPRTLAATVPASIPVGVYPLSVESPFRERVTARDGFEVRAGGCSGPPGALAVTASVAPNAVTVGQQVTVTAVVRNTGQHPVFEVEPLVSSAPAGAVLLTGPVPAGDPEIRGNEVTTFTWTYSTTEVVEPPGATFIIAVAGADELGGHVAAPLAATNPLLVNLPANVTAHTHAPTRANVGQVITFALEVENTGAAPALVVTGMAPVVVSGIATVTRLSNPPSQTTMPPSSTRSLVWTVAASGPCQIEFTVGLTATDLNSGQALTVAPTPPVTVTVESAAALSTTVNAGAVVPVGQAVNVTATVRNTGQATATGVAATMFAAPAQFLLEVEPVGTRDVVGGGSTTFTWRYRASEGASVGTFAVDAAGLDANSLSTVTAPRAVSGEVAVAYPVGGTVSGLTRSGLELRNGSDTLPVQADGPFSFPTLVASGATYAVTVSAQPRGQTCVVTAGGGTVGAGPVTSVAVTCARDTHTFTASVDPAGAGTVTCGGSPCLATYPYSEVPMQILATPTLGWSFSGWGGDCTGVEPSCLLTMEADRAVAASFAPVLHPLVATASPAGAGTLTCNGEPCLASYLHGAVVEIAATPAVGRAFTGWSGDCSGTGPCSVTMDASRTVTAHFALVPYPLATNVSPAATGTLTCNGEPCLASYPYGTVLAIAAAPADGWAFTGWSGDCGGTGPCSVTMDASRTVTAHFALVPYALTASVTPEGGGSLTCNGEPCRPSYAYATVLEIAAIPAEGFEFVRWSGDCGGTHGCSVTMDQDRTVVAELTATTLGP